MATVLLFAQAREAAGTNRLTSVGTTVGEVIAGAVATHPGLARVVPHCKVWINGEPATDNDPVSDLDEVALLPPVSGGA
jgi:molybdopterin converting factor small subunit